jgi:inosine-uridine nucleoside N-ribohydrolase
MNITMSKIPVILDTDIGDDIDDTWALAMLLGCPEVDLKLIVTASDNTPERTRLVAKMLEHMGRTDIPIGTGKKTSDIKHFQEAWVGDYRLDNYRGTVYEDGVQAMIDHINSSDEPVTLCVIGPQTNIAEALRRDPGIARNARVITMAGSVYIGYNGSSQRSAEWNVVQDIEAVRVVMSAPWEITMAPLDVCGTLRLEGDRYTSVTGSQSALASVVIGNYTHWAHRHSHPEDASSILYDTVAAYLTFAENLTHIQTVNLSIDDTGNTVPDKNGFPFGVR